MRVFPRDEWMLGVFHLLTMHTSSGYTGLDPCSWSRSPQLLGRGPVEVTVNGGNPHHHPLHLRFLVLFFFSHPLSCVGV